VVRKKKNQDSKKHVHALIKNVWLSWPAIHTLPGAQPPAKCRSGLLLPATNCHVSYNTKFIHFKMYSVSRYFFRELGPFGLKKFDWIFAGFYFPKNLSLELV
jgi:hypothetical protein